MKNGYLTKMLLGCLLCSLVVIASCCINIGCWSQAKYERTDELWAELEPGSTVAVQTSFGSITVTGADVTRCDVIAEVCVQAPTKEEAEKIAEKVQVRLEPVGKTLTVKVNKPHVGNNRSIGVSFDITVPKQTNIECTTSFGSIRLADINGNVKATTSFAAIDSKNIQGSVNLATSYGHINCQHITSGDLTVRSSFGGIDITYSDSAPAEMVANVATSYGSIDFVSPPGFTGWVDLATSFGSIKTDLPITVKGKISKDRIKGTVGDGKGKLNLKTSFGSIRIR